MVLASGNKRELIKRGSFYWQLLPQLFEIFHQKSKHLWLNIQNSSKYGLFIGVRKTSSENSEITVSSPGWCRIFISFRLSNKKKKNQGKCQSYRPKNKVLRVIPHLPYSRNNAHCLLNEIRILLAPLHIKIAIYFMLR